MTIPCIVALNVFLYVLICESVGGLNKFGELRLNLVKGGDGDVKMV